MEAEFQARSHGLCELLRIKYALEELGVKHLKLIELCCDNKRLHIIDTT